MPASYPTSLKVFTARADGEVVYAAHMNEVQEEVAAIQAILGTAPQGASATVKARIANLESTKLDASAVSSIDHNSLANLATGDPHTQYITKAIGTARGDLLAYTGSGTVARRAVGTNGHVLTADSAEATGLKWAAIPADGTSTLTTKGDILTRTTSALTRKAVGTNGQALVADSADASGLSWAGVVRTAGGDTITASAAGVIPVVVKGAAGQTANLIRAVDANDVFQAGITADGAVAAAQGTMYFGSTTAAQRVYVYPKDAAQKGLVVQGFASQSANLQEWQDSTGAVLARIGNNGFLEVGHADTFISALNGRGQFASRDATVVPLTARGFTGQTGPLQQWRDGTGAVVGEVSPTGATTLKKTIRIPHTWHIPGEVKVASGDSDYVMDFEIPAPTGQTVATFHYRGKINSGTSATVSILRNGTAMAGYSGIVLTPGGNGASPTPVALADGDDIRLLVTAVSGTPKNLQLTLSLEYTF